MKEIVKQRKVNKLTKQKVKNSKQKGITLIALVVTIVVLLILAGISISLVFGEDGIINAAKQAAIKKAQAEKEEEVRLAITAILLRNDYDESKVTVSEVVDEVKKNYTKQEQKDSISGASTGETEDKFPGIIQYDKPSSSIDGTIIVEVDENLNVTSSVAGDQTGDPTEPDPPIELPESEYKQVGETYYYTPELNKFNPKNTYYITYDESGGNETVYGRLDKVEEPTDWYDYEKKIWANLVTVNGEEVTYWTWIPRYKYKVDAEGQTIDVKFVDENDSYKGNEQVDLTEYKLPESFTFDDKPLKGYWMSKYEVQDSSSDGLEKIQLEPDARDVSIYVTTTKPSGKYTIYLDGEFLEEGVTLPHYIKGLEANKEYAICLVNETARRMVGEATMKTEILNDSAKDIEVDLSGFNPDCTYYVTYDENGGNEKRGEKIQLKDGKPTNMPENWYDYDKKRWANVVTISGDDENGDYITYWTYIPRYEYKAWPLIQFVNLKYIPVSQDKPDEGYTIPESFKFAEKPLKGFWISKYEIQESDNQGLEKLQLEPDARDGSIYITTTKPSGTYKIYVDGQLHKEGQTLPYHLPNVTLDKEYEIQVYSEKAERTVGTARETVRSNNTTSNIEVDLSGFNPDCTYYVTYDDKGGNETIGAKIQLENGKATNMPNNWYDYGKKIWANVVTKGKDESGNELTTYWTYIPRYEYKTWPLLQYTEIRYIPLSQEKASDGYKLPESFTFAEKQLKGFWVSKYEVQNK